MPQKQDKNIKEIGHIVSYFSGVAKIQGLPHVFLNETLLDENDNKVAIVIGFDERYVEAIFFNDGFDEEKPLFRSRELFSIPVSDDYIGKIVDGFGQPINKKDKIFGERASIFKNSPDIIDREPVVEPLSTGIKIIDTSLPLGKGQRELIVGDRKIGKSSIAQDVVLNQKDKNPEVYCVYVLCGKKKSQIEDLVHLFKKNYAFAYSCVVVASADDTFASQYLAPFVGCAIGEYFRDKGKDALVVYDDLSNHAKVFRNISLLLERAPGREAYPGDIFSLHAGLLERAAKLSKKNGGGSLTALPIIETQEGDITSFIPTNLISITDGQIYLDIGLYQKRFMPAINVGLSVSRVGSQAQPKILKGVTEGIRLALAQHKELQKLTQLETVVSKEAKDKIKRGDLILELLKQNKHTNVRWEEQVILFYVVESGFFDDTEKEHWSEFENLLLELIRNHYQNVLGKISSGLFDDDVKKSIKEIVDDFKREFLP